MPGPLLHASGWYGAKNKKFQADLNRWTNKATIITLTEVAAPRRRRILSRITRRQPAVPGRPAPNLPHWTRTSGRGEGPGETAILSNRDTWKRLRRRIPRIHPGGGRGRLARPLHATLAVLQRRATGRLLIATTTHLPAHVETALRLWDLRGRAGKPATAQARAWLTAIDQWAAYVANYQRQYPDADFWIPADWNLNAQQRWVRQLILDRFAAAGVTGLRVAAATRGTLGNRTVDFALTTLSVDDAAVLDANASDHRATLFAARWSTRWR